MARSELSFPHPVLGNGDDVSIGQLEPEVTFDLRDESLRIHVGEMVTHNPTIDRMLDSGQALRSIRIHCPRTYFRTTEAATVSSWEHAFRGEDLEGRVEILVTVRTTGAVPGYLPAGAHPDYAGVQFDLEPAEVLAVSPPREFSVDKVFDSLKAPVSSLMRISEGQHPTGPFEVVLDDDLIEILLSQEDWYEWPGVRDRMPDLAHSAIVLPVLAEAIRKVQSAARQELRWARRLLALLERGELDVGRPLDAAQALLDAPVSRTFRQLNATLDERT